MRVNHQRHSDKLQPESGILAIARNIVAIAATVVRSQHMHDKYGCGKFLRPTNSNSVSQSLEAPTLCISRPRCKLVHEGENPEVLPLERCGTEPNLLEGARLPLLEGIHDLTC